MNISMIRQKIKKQIRLADQNRSEHFRSIITALLLLSLNFQLSAQDIIIKINLRGVYESKISLMPLSGPNALKSIAESEGFKNGETAKITVSRDRLPGEFVLRFDYKEKESSTRFAEGIKVLMIS